MNERDGREIFYPPLIISCTCNDIRLVDPLDCHPYPAWGQGAGSVTSVAIRPCRFNHHVAMGAAGQDERHIPASCAPAVPSPRSVPIRRQLPQFLMGGRPPRGCWAFVFSCAALFHIVLRLLIEFGHKVFLAESARTV
jgi:hypothetical protein